MQSDHLIKAIYRFSDCIDMTEKAMRNLHDVMGDYWEDDWPSSEKYYITLQVTLPQRLEKSTIAD